MNHQPDKGHIINRRQKVNTGNTAKHFLCRLSKLRIRMNRKKEFEFCQASAELLDGRKDFLYLLRAIFSPLGRD